VELEIPPEREKIMTDNRITPQDIEDAIEHVFYFTTYEGVLGERFNHEGPGDNDSNEGKIPDQLKLMTVCVLLLKNGFTVLGTSACADPANFNKELGQNLAREKAKEQLWPLLGFELRSRLNAVYMTDGKVSGLSISSRPGAEASAPAKRAEGERQAEGHDAVGTGPAEEALNADLIAVERQVVPPSRSNKDPYDGEQ
jgi:hypothetical protein